MTFKSINKYSFIVLFAVIVLAGCDKREQNIAYAPGIADNLVTIASKESNLTIFVAAVKRTGLDADIALLGNYTIFAPTDAAFAASGITATTINTLPIDLLRSVLRNHLISGRILSTDLLPGPNAPYTSVHRQILNSSFYAGNSYLNGKKISKVNLLANNGVIHQIDGVLMPPLNNLMGTLAANADLTFLAAAITRAGLATTVNTTTTLLTVLAPTNDAFKAAGFPDIASIEAADPAVLGNIIKYHVIPSTSLISGTLSSPLNRAGRAFSIDFTNGTNVVTAQGTSVGITVSGNSIQVKGNSNASQVTVSSADILYFAGTASARPGVLHIINGVLLP
jgi:uncharacterized surface protein with fasciclin (FAS1) repeats